MEILKRASAGTMESSDAYVEIEPGRDGLNVQLALEAAQGAPRAPRRDSRGERSPWLPLETRPDSPGEPG